MNARVVRDLSQLPRVADGWSFVYTDRVRVEKADHAIELRDKTGRVAVPIAALSVLMLGPGSVITHAAMLALGESGCSVVWCGEDGVRFYASGLGETRRARNLEAQAMAWASKEQHALVVRRMYLMRFPEHLPDDLTLEQIRGREGVRVRQTYARLSKETGVPWGGRSYRTDNWGAADPVNRALSCANACLYGLCHAAIVATGFAPGLGFVHVGKQLSFVYDIADLYKADVTIPAAFQAVAEGTSQVESRIRRRCRELFRSTRLLERIVPDVQRVIGLTPTRATITWHRDSDAVDDEEGMGEAPGDLWNEDDARVPGGQNHGPGAIAVGGPTLAKTRPSDDRGDAYEEESWPLAASDDDDGAPF